MLEAVTWDTERFRAANILPEHQYYVFWGAARGRILSLPRGRP